jgi:hypothetical protein
MENPIPQYGTKNILRPRLDTLLSLDISTLPEKELTEIQSFVLTYFGHLAKLSSRDVDFQRELTNMLVFGFSPIYQSILNGRTESIKLQRKNSTKATTESGKGDISETRKLSNKRKRELKEKTVHLSQFVPPETTKLAKKMWKERLIMQMANPKVEKLARRYAEAICTKHDVSMQDLADETGLTKSQVTDLISKEQFPIVLQKYLPIEKTMERHNDLMMQDEDLGVAAKMVELSYKAHGKLTPEGKEKKSDFANFLQQINVTNTYGASSNKGEPARHVVEVTTPVQNQEQAGSDSEPDFEQGADGVPETRDEAGRDSEGPSDGVLDTEAHPASR